jgi:hypothetical protein
LTIGFNLGIFNISSNEGDKMETEQVLITVKIETICPIDEFDDGEHGDLGTSILDYVYDGIMWIKSKFKK